MKKSHTSTNKGIKNEGNLGSNNPSFDDVSNTKAIEREAKFKAWLTNKSLRDKTIELLGKISKLRAEDDNDLKEVGITLCAVDEILSRAGSNSLTTSKPKDDIDGEIKSEKASGPKPLRTYWMKWAMETHNFNMVELTDADVASLSGAVREFIDTTEKGKNILPSLKYFFPAVPKNPKEKAKPLTNDQKIQNGIYMKLMSKIWRDAKQELQDRVKEYVARKMQQAMKAGADSNGEPVSQLKLEMQALNELSIKQLNAWVEEDEDKSSKALNEEEQEKMRLAKVTHEQWVRNKDSLRIRIPDNLPVKTPPITYGREFSGVRPTGGPSGLSIIQAMADSGLKYVHASGRGKQGAEGDLEKTRKQLLNLGYVYQENFDADDMGDFHSQRRNNPALREKKENEMKLKEDSAKAYEEWLVYKDMKDQALKCLNLISPVLKKANDEKSVGPRASVLSIGSQNSLTRKSQQQHTYTKQDYDHVINIGKALKKVDRTLFSEWSKWSEGVIKPNIASILWESFKPIACDVHSMAYSQIRDTFVKLLRPGFDYKTTFTEFARKLNGQDSDRDDDKGSNIGLDKDQMQKLLRQMGIVMKPNEMRLLVDAFDANNDGTITLQEFIEFTGPKRDKKSGSGQALNRRCCWLTTCRITGMTNAYVVSALPKQGRGPLINNLVEAKYVEAKGSRESVRDSKDSEAQAVAGMSGTIQIKSLPSGEKRMVVELKERKTREDILRSFGLLTISETDINKADGKKSKVRREEIKDEYDNDFEEEPNAYDEDFDDGGPNKNENSSGNDDRCDASKWSREDRAEGLQYLLDVSKDAREEDILKTILTSGKPPKPPQFWCEFEMTNDDQNQSENLSRSDELRLCWGPQRGDLVSFYSLEYAGVSKFSQGSDVQYREVFRDPPDANPDSKFKFCYVMGNLSPGTSYLFRLRAFNGYGPGEFVYKVFTTKTGAPPAPRAMTTSSDAVVLRWLFSDSFNKRMFELKKLFQLADEDNSGAVSREEFVAVLDDKHSPNSELKKFLSKAAQNRGIDVSNGFSALFDVIEGDDNGSLSWAEFEEFFMSYGWADSSTTSTAVNMSQERLRNSSTSMSNTVTQSITYIVEKCESEFDNTYSTVMKTNTGKAMISRLLPGESYRFRVYSVNVDGVSGPKSDSVIVHTMLETPAPPTVTLLGTSSLTLNWKPRVQAQSTRSKQVVDRMLGDWAGTHNEDDKGVSIESAFAKYDRDGSEDIDASELALMLNDLGVEATEERVRLAIDILDLNGDGRVSFEEFGKWWRRDEVSYTIKRSEPISRLHSDGRISQARIANNSDRRNDGDRAFGLSMIPEETTLDGSDLGRSASRGSIQRPKSAPRGRVSSVVSSSSQSLRAPQASGITRDVPVPIVSYRGTQNKVNISGLEPNRLYHFKLRYVGSRSNSSLSKPLVIMTKPLPPSQPIVVELGPTIIRLKWYAPKNGAYKFGVQFYKDTIASATIKKSNTNSGEGLSNDGWVTVFVGQETFWTCTTITPESSYRVRVVGYNFQGACSEPSPEILITSPHRLDTTNELLSPKNVDVAFSVECTHDICVGDTILITERLYAKAKASDASNSNTDAVRESISKLKASSDVRTSSAMSIASLLSEGKPEAMGTFIGERTIAAHVVKDNYRTVREIVMSSGTSDPDISNGIVATQISRHRRLWLEVVWQKAKSPACKPYEVKPGEVIERLQNKLESYEVFRCPWKQEEKRLPLRVEWSSLQECYVQME